MGLDIPELDDRTYDELLEQATTLIPAYSSEWTDFNPHDPGITILEVLAWLTETHTYQLDQITDEHRESYLRLIGYERRPPTPATARIRLDPPSDAAGARLPAGTPVAVTDGTESVFQFETDYELTLTAASIDRVMTVDETGATDHRKANQTDGMFYRPFGDTVDQGACVYLGFDRDPFAIADRLTLAVAYHDDNLPEPSLGTDTDGDRPTFSPSVDLAWEYHNPETGYWQPLSVAVDETNALYRDGHLELVVDEATTDSSDRPRSAAEGTLPETPPLELDDTVWLRCRVDTPDYEFPPQLETISTNVVTASHNISIIDEQLSPVGADARGAGGAATTSTRNTDTTPILDSQTYAVKHTPVLSASVRVDGERFVEVPDFVASGPNDPHYVLDRTRGHITFGDGVSGCVPDPDATITADYVAGGGTAGNVSDSAVWRITDSSTSFDSSSDVAVSPTDLEITPLGPATGGTNRESVADALRRARRDRRRTHRAVTADDYRALVSRTPGLRIGRTNVVVESEGTTVVVVPYAPVDVSSPEPSDGFLEAIYSHLRERTLLTDRVHVTGPQYVRLELDVTGRTRPRYTGGGYEAAITEAVESYLHPLYGYDGSGWPFGRTLESEELIEVIESVDAIDQISDVSMTAYGGTALDGRVISIDDTSLFTVETVTVDLRTADDGGY
ncbi:putative baseplate assembly protein [Natrialba chahannaoensis]|nr:putative baseplate assembly protein [Natrialba chahannaoensis]